MSVTADGVLAGMSIAAATSSPVRVSHPIAFDGCGAGYEGEADRTSPIQEPDPEDYLVDGEDLSDEDGLAYENALAAYETFYWEGVEEVLAEDFFNQVELVFGSRYGGMWGDRSGPKGVQRVGVQNGTSEDQATLDSLTNANPRITVAPVKYSKVTLKSWADQVFSLLNTQEHSVHMVGSDSEKNKVVAYTDRLDPEVALKISALVPPDAIEIHLGSSYELTSKPSASITCLDNTPPDQS